MDINVSVIICCYNSAALLESTLDHLAKQEREYLNFEVVLVDNNSSDDTIAVANEKWKELLTPFPLRVVKEKQLGLSFARKTGVLAASGEIIIFCDDDNWLSENYLSEAYNLFKLNKSIFGVCGYCEPVAKVNLPNWFAEYSDIYACGQPQVKDNKSEELITLRGAGMAVKSEVIKDLYCAEIAHFATDRKSQSLSSGGDDEISFWLKILGGKLLFSEKLKLKHYMTDSRLTIEYRDRLLNGIHNSIRELRFKNDIIKLALRPKRKKDFFWIFMSGAKGIAARLKFGFNIGIDNRLVTNVKVLKKLQKKYQWMSQ